MLYLKEANIDDMQKEYEVITRIPFDENGFTNEYENCSFEEFKEKILPSFINHAKGIDLKDGFVPDTNYFLWDGFVIVGLFHFRHYLNDFLMNGPGHIGYCILKEYRGKGYGEKGLKLLIDLVKDHLQEDEIYMSCAKTNPASLHVMLKNGAYIHYEDEKEYYTRIKIK